MTTTIVVLDKAFARYSNKDYYYTCKTTILLSIMGLDAKRGMDGHRHQQQHFQHLKYQTNTNDEDLSDSTAVRT